jgi:branched-chain amino acid transport system ATP-binding protein
VTMLEVRGLEAGFGSNTVLHGVDLELEPGSSLGLFGLNGAGKSVTMKVIAGLVPAWGGSVSFDGTDVTRMQPEDRTRSGMAYMPQARQLFARLSVEQNLRLGAAVLKKRDRSRAEEVVRSIYERFPRLDERRRQLAGSLSGGEQAMLAIGRALAGDPKLLLVDEPSAGLAPAALTDIRSMLDGLRRDGLTILLVEQNITFGFRLVERAAIMQRGQVVYEGPVDDLDTARVADLLGVGRLLGSHLERALGSKARTARKTRTSQQTRTKR